MVWPDLDYSLPERRSPSGKGRHAMNINDRLDPVLAWAVGLLVLGVWSFVRYEGKMARYL